MKKIVIIALLLKLGLPIQAQSLVIKKADGDSVRIYYHNVKNISFKEKLKAETHENDINNFSETEDGGFFMRVYKGMTLLSYQREIEKTLTLGSDLSVGCNGFSAQLVNIQIVRLENAPTTIDIKYKPKLILGDVNRDGIISPLDASLILQLLVHKIETKNIDREAADVNGDQSITPQDASLILQHIAH